MALVGGTFEDATVRITDLVQTGESILDEVTFRRCRIVGPVVMVIEESDLLDNRFETESLDSLLWVIPNARTNVTGAVLARRCLFQDCTFDRVGVAGSEHMLAGFREPAGVRHQGDPAPAAADLVKRR